MTQNSLFTKRNLYVYATLLSFAVLFAIILSSMYAVPTGNVQVIRIIGAITATSDIFSSTVSSSEVITAIESAEANPNIKAIILEINSPGGTVVGSAEIVEKLKQVEKPTVAWIREVGTSGAYWVATATDAIVAHNLSLTGSVGVTGSYLEFTGFMEDYRIGYVNLSKPENKEIGSPFRQMTEEEMEILDNILEETYNYFLEDVSNNRNIDIEILRENTKKGAIILGKDAYELDLVDYLGGKETAINVTKGLANITEVELIETRTSVSLIDILANLKSNFNIFEKGIFSLKA